MCPNNPLRFVFAVALLVAAQLAQAAPRTLALLLGDVESRPAVLAVRALRPALAAADVAVRIVPASGMTPADHAALAHADAAVVDVKDSRLLQLVAPDLDALRRRARPVFAVGAKPDDALRAQGLRFDAALYDDQREGGVENMQALLRRMLRASFGAQVDVPPPRTMPEAGLYDVDAERGAATFDDYAAHYAHLKPGAPWIGVMFYRASLVAGQTLVLAAIVHSLEDAGYNVLPAYGYPYDVPLKLFLDGAGKSRIDLLVALGMKVGGTAATGALLDRIGVPAINAITLSRQTAAQWEDAKVGLDLMERSWQMAGAEIAGLIQPTVVASREAVIDPVTGLAYVEETPIPERVARLRARVDAWLALRRAANADKRVALVYYEDPHGTATIGAAYLNVLPDSLWQITERLRAAGYTTGARYPASPAALQRDILQWGRTPDRRASRAALAHSGEALLVPLDDYRRWYDALPAKLRTAVEQAWGPPETSDALWTDAHGRAYFVFAARRYGNLLLAPQPVHAWEAGLAGRHGGGAAPPAHDYIAFYLWLQHGFDANAVVHLGTHGTEEWLAGKEAGLSSSDPAEALIGAMPNIYPYVMDDVGEGIQAKRRGMAVIVDHMTPPFDSAGLNPDLRELGALLNDYRVAEQKSPTLARARLEALNAQARKAGVLKDLGKTALAGAADMEALEDYLADTAGKPTPFGLHTFGVAPPPDLRAATARAVVGMDPALDADQQAGRAARLDAQMVTSAEGELAHLVDALDGRFVPTGPSADLLRNPDALPTGRNFYGLDPARIPGRAVYEQGRQLATQLVEDYRRRHGAYPDRLTMNLWGAETQRHEGVIEAQAMALMGVRPTWDARGRVTGVEAIPRRELGRPRIDVTMVASGLFRDLFGNVMTLLDQAVQLARAQRDDDDPRGNVLAAHARAAAAALERRGVAHEEAERLAGARLFGPPSGNYGTGIGQLLPRAGAGQDARQVAGVFIDRMGHPFGSADDGDEDQRRAAFRLALAGSKIALHSRSGNLFATLDNDDFVQSLGGTALAIRSIDGTTPEVLVADLSNPRKAGLRTLDRTMGQEMQARYLNPRWAERMLKEGYAGTRFVGGVVDALWAWQVTVPDAVDGGSWQRMYDTWVADRHGLRVRARFAAAGNLRAWQAITDRMLSAVEQGYWKPDAATRARLLAANARAVAQAGVACGADACSKATLLLARWQAGRAPGITAGQGGAATQGTSRPPPRPAPITAPPQPEAVPKADHDIRGFEMETVSQITPAQKTIGALVLLACAAAVVGGGYLWRRR